MLRSFPLLLLCLVLGIVICAGCPGTATPIPSTPSTGGTGGNGGGGTGGNEVRLNLTLQGLTGFERNMTANVYIGSGPVSRTNTGGLTVQQCQAQNLVSQLCSFGGNIGQVATIIALSDAGGSTPLTPLSPPPFVPNSAVDFVNFGPGCDSQPELGVCVVTLNADREIVANYNKMRGLVVQQVGADTINVTIRATPPLTVPPSVISPISTGLPIRLGPNCNSPVPQEVFFTWLPRNSTVTLTAIPSGFGPAFLGWTGACAGAATAPDCTLTFADVNQTTTARFQYFNCTNVNTPCASFSMDPSCTLVTPP